MKKKILIGIVAGFLLLPLVKLGAEEVIGDIRPNILYPGRLDVVDKNGISKYYLERDILNQERWIIYHRDSGHKAGVIERNPLRLYDRDFKLKAPTGARIKKARPRFRRFNR